MITMAKEVPGFLYLLMLSESQSAGEGILDPGMRPCSLELDDMGALVGEVSLSQYASRLPDQQARRQGIDERVDTLEGAKLQDKQGEGAGGVCACGRCLLTRSRQGGVEVTHVRRQVEFLSASAGVRRGCWVFGRSGSSFPVGTPCRGKQGFGRAGVRDS